MTPPPAGVIELPHLPAPMDGIWDTILELGRRLPPDRWALIGGQIPSIDSFAADQFFDRVADGVAALTRSRDMGEGGHSEFNIPGSMVDVGHAHPQQFRGANPGRDPERDQRSVTIRRRGREDLVHCRTAVPDASTKREGSPGTPAVSTNLPILGTTSPARSRPPPSSHRAGRSGRTTAA